MPSTKRRFPDRDQQGPLAGFVLALPAAAWGLAHSHVVHAPSPNGMWFGESILYRLLESAFAPPGEIGRMQRIAVVTHPTAIRAILRSVGLAADSPAPAPARLPCQMELLGEA